LIQDELVSLLQLDGRDSIVRVKTCPHSNLVGPHKLMALRLSHVPPTMEFHRQDATDEIPFAMKGASIECHEIIHLRLEVVDARSHQQIKGGIWPPFMLVCVYQALSGNDHIDLESWILHRTGPNA